MLTSILDQPPMIQFHIATALVAVVLAPVILLRRRGDRLHRWLGYLWIAAMGLTALSSFQVFTLRLIGPFSPIHLLSIFTLWALQRALRAARAGRIAVHRQAMSSLVIGLTVAGLFTLFPGRFMSKLLFGPAQTEGFAAALVLSLAAGGWLLWRHRRLQPGAGG